MILIKATRANCRMIVAKETNGGDIVLSLRHLFAAAERGQLFHVMVDRLGLRSAIESRPHAKEVMKRAQQRCADCGREDECQVWLAENETAREAPCFCKNHDMFERLKHDIEIEKALQTA
ncbi:MAG: hypothetical protein Kow0026_09570 [Oricola sp.]